MMSNNTEDTAKAPSNTSFSPAQFQDDEIDLLDIWRILLRQRKWIITIALIVSVAAVVYAFVSPPVYKAEAFLLPPLAKDIAVLDVLSRCQAEDVDSKNAKDYFTPEKVFQQAVLNLKLHSLQRHFLGQYKDVNGTFAVRASGKGDIPGGSFVSMEGGEPAKLVTAVNEFVEFVDAYTAKELADLQAEKLASAKAEIRTQIIALRNQAKQERLDRITALEESLTIAKKLAITEMVVNPADSPLYLRGTGAISSEIEVLKKRKDDDAFTPGLREFQENISTLNRVKLDLSQVHSARVDRPAILPHKPIRPKRLLIIVIGTILGLMAGVFMAFVMNFIENARRGSKSEYL